MRLLTLAVAAVSPLLTTTPAFAQGSIVDACTKAAAFEIGMDGRSVSNVQAFPELSPPRVQLDVVGPGAASIAEEVARAINGERPTDEEPALEKIATVRCTFERSSSPVGLTSFECEAFACIIPDARVEELRVLLEREGF